MLRATRALAAMLTSGALACTFDHSGLLTGPLPDDEAPRPLDASGSDGREVAESSADGAEDANPSPEGPSDEEVTAGDAAGVDSNDEPDAGAEDSPSPLDSSPDVPSLDEAGDVALPDGAFDCAGVPNGASFLPPDATSLHCYWLHPGMSNWLSAANICSAQHGHLLTLSSDAETEFVLSLVTTFPSSDHIWIGGTDTRFSNDGPGSGPYAWLDGEPMTYQNWYSDATTQEPDGLCEDCDGNACYCEHRAAIVNDGRWVDAYEALSYRFICETEL